MLRVGWPLAHRGYNATDTSSSESKAIYTVGLGLGLVHGIYTANENDGECVCSTTGTMGCPLRANLYQSRLMESHVEHYCCPYSKPTKRLTYGFQWEWPDSTHIQYMVLYTLDLGNVVAFLVK